MVSGFLGALIGMERAVALGRRWAFAAPLLAGAGSVLTILGLPQVVARAVFALASALLAAVFAALYRRQPALPPAVMGAGVLSWLGGNLVWMATCSLPLTVPWWTAFLVLMIAGERLELSRVARPPRWATTTFVLLGILLLTGPPLALVSAATGIRTSAAAMVGMAAWLLRYDPARPLLRLAGLHRFTAANLLAGYLWLLAAGILWFAAPGPRGGYLYDARLHAVFVGFVFSMVFAHAPIILPAVLGRTVPYRPAFYGHAALLHAGLVLRVAADLIPSPPGRRWGALLNTLALVLFLVNTARAGPLTGLRTAL